MTAAKKLPPITKKRKEEYIQAFVDKELKTKVISSLPKGMKIRDAVTRGLLHVLNETNPRAAKKLLHIVK